MHFRLARASVAALALVPLFSIAASAQDLTLAAAVKAALAQHPLVTAARARVDAARGERITAGALPNPVATVWLENAPFFPAVRPTIVNSEVSTYLTLPLEPLIQRSPRRQRADEDVKAAEAGVIAAERGVAAAAARAFFRVAEAQALAEEAEENWGRVDDLASYLRARVDEGATAEGELLRVQVESDRLAIEAALAGVELTRRRGELAPYLGDGRAPVPLASIRISMPEGAIEALPRPMPADLDVWVARARDQRPELLGARARVAAAAATADYERTLAVRQLGATFGSKRIDGHNSMIAGLNVAIPLFNRNRGGIARASSERVTAEQELAWAERAIVAEVQAAYEAAAALTRQLTDLQASLVAKAENVDQLTLAAYREGGATLMQVLDANRIHADARLTRSRVLFAQRQSLFDLALAAGTPPLDAGGTQ
jgi:cobalt-zinc-cadmium efflux system outer membrane protein